MHPQGLSHFEVKGHLIANLIEIMLISNIYSYNFNREKDKNINNEWLMWNYLLIPFVWQSVLKVTCCTQSDVQNGCQIILCLTQCYSRSVKWLLKQVIFHNNLKGKGHKNITIPKVTHAVGSKHTLSYINSVTPFEIKYYLRAVLWKIIHISNTYV